MTGPPKIKSFPGEKVSEQMRLAFAQELCQTWQGPSFISRGDCSSVTFIGNIDWHQEGTSLADEHSTSCRHCKNLPQRVAFWPQSNKEKEVSMGVRDTLQKHPHNETWAFSGAATVEEAEILHVDVRSVSLGMGKGGFLWASRNTTSTKSQNWGVGLHDEEPASLGWGICHCHAGRTQGH